MTLFNTGSKLLVYTTVWFSMFISLGIIGGSLYALLSDWGPVDTNFLIGPCITLLMYGVILFGGSITGYLGLMYQYRRQGVFTHKLILTIFILIQLACIAVEIWTFIAAAQVVTDYHNAAVSLDTNKNIPYFTSEKYLSTIFNNVFFGSAGLCTAVRSFFFWQWISARCPASLHKETCLKCFPFSPSNCGADQNTCYADSTADGFACPYTICRKGILNYFVEEVGLLEECAVALIAFQCFIVILVAILIVHHEVKIDVRRRSIVKRTGKPKTLGRKRKSILPATAQGRSDLEMARQTVKNQPKFAHVDKDAPPEEIHDIKFTLAAPSFDV